MCLYPRRIANKKYTATKKNGGIIPDPPITGTDDLGLPIYDRRVLEIEVPCGQCIECRNQKAREWTVRLNEEIKDWKYKYMVTLTFAPKELKEICKKTRLSECNAVAGYAVRHMLERWRKRNKTSIRHWFITELGHEGTERIHLHGLLFSNQELEFGDMDDNKQRDWWCWKYGKINLGDYVNERTINYIAKYITKIDTDHKGFVGEIMASPGIGIGFIDRLRARNDNTYKYRPRKTIDYYRIEQTGAKVKLPKYYANKERNEDERELKWRDFMDMEQVTIAGNTYSKTSTSKETISNVMETAKQANKFLGYGDNSGEWRKKEYNVTRRMLQQIERKKQMDLMAERLKKRLEQENLHKNAIKMQNNLEV